MKEATTQITGKLTPDMIPPKEEPTFHYVQPRDRKRIRCNYCGAPAYICLYNQGPHFSYFCEEHQWGLYHGLPVPPPEPTIEPGDFIKSRLAPMCLGIVLQRGSIPFGKERIEGYLITTANGAVDFIDAESAVFIAR